MPITTAGGSYPALHGEKPKHKRDSLFEQAMEELHRSWSRFNSGWYKAALGTIPEKISLKDVIEDQDRRLFEMVQEMENEFGAIITKEGDEIELAFFQVGKEHEIDLAPTRPLKDNEFLLGTIHGHPTRDFPSTTDIYTFLESWELVAIIMGSK